MRERFTENNTHAVFELRAAGFGTKKIKGYTGLSESSIRQLDRTKIAIVAGDYLQALREIGAHNSQKLTDYSVNKIWWICDANKIPKMSREELDEEWKKLVGEIDEEPEGDSREPEQITFKGSETLQIYGNLKYMLDHNPIQKVIDYINDQFDKLK